MDASTSFFGVYDGHGGEFHFLLLMYVVYHSISQGVIMNNMYLILSMCLLLSSGFLISNNLLLERNHFSESRLCCLFQNTVLVLLISIG